MKPNNTCESNTQVKMRMLRRTCYSPLRCFPIWSALTTLLSSTPCRCCRCSSSSFLSLPKPVLLQFLISQNGDASHSSNLSLAPEIPCSSSHRNSKFCQTPAPPQALSACPHVSYTFTSALTQTLLVFHGASLPSSLSPGPLLISLLKIFHLFSPGFSINN